MQIESCLIFLRSQKYVFRFEDTTGAEREGTDVDFENTDFMLVLWVLADAVLQAARLLVRLGVCLTLAQGFQKFIDFAFSRDELPDQSARPA